MTERYMRGAVEVRPRERCVLLHGTKVPLGARALDVLMVLVQRRGSLVTKDELLDAVWPGVAVDENNLAVQVSNLRKALGSLCITTVPGRGYTFTAAVEGSQPDGIEARDAPAAVRPAPLPPVAAPATLVGRDNDIATVGERMAEQALVVLTGAGGIGKTRLARHLFDERATASTDAPLWVDLAAISDAGRVPQAIGHALGWGAGAPNSLPALVRALAQEQRLVVLDNAEHLAAEVAGVVSVLLREAPRVHWLVTSQVPLGLAQETIVRLEPLDLPAMDADVTRAQAASAIQFFVQRARAADRRFALDGHNVGEVVAICHRLDGMPLALEMAAARIPLLGLERLAALVAEQLDSLRSQRRDLPERQRTLRATLEWSHSLLGLEEQAALRRLGVFVGGFSLEMALDVVGATDDEEQRWHWLDCLEELIERSLVAVNHDQELRYRLLESTRAFALERLAAAGEEAMARRRHVRATIKQLASVRKRMDNELLTSDDGIKLLVLELENARAAHAWSVANDAALALELMPLYSAVTRELDRHATNAAWEATIPLYDEALPARLRAEWAMPLTFFLWNAHDIHGARRWVEVTRSLCEQLDDNRIRFGLARMDLFLALHEGGDVDSAMAAVIRTSESGTSYVRQQVPVLLAHAERQRNRLPQALAWASQAVELVRGTGNRTDYLARLNNLAGIHFMLGQYERAAELLTECSEQARAPRFKHVLCNATLNLCELQVRTGQVDAATRSAIEGWALAETFQMTPLWIDVLALLAAHRDRAAASAQLVGHSEALRQSLGLSHDIAMKAVLQLTLEKLSTVLPAADLAQQRTLGAALDRAGVHELVRILLSDPRPAVVH